VKTELKDMEIKHH